MAEIRPWKVEHEKTAKWSINQGRFEGRKFDAANFSGGNMDEKIVEFGWEEK